MPLDRSILDGSPLLLPLPPHIHAQYYAAIIAAEAIGRTGQSQAIELEIDSKQVSGYAFYENRKLTSAIFINLEAYLKSSMVPRSSVHLGFDLLGLSDQPSFSMAVKRLSVGHADDTEGFTWGGQSYETPDGRVSGSLDIPTLPLSDGVDIAATEVVMLNFS